MAVLVFLVYFYTALVIEKKTKFSTESTKIRHFDPKIFKKKLGKGALTPPQSGPFPLRGGRHTLPTLHPLWRLRRFDSCL